MRTVRGTTLLRLTVVPTQAMRGGPVPIRPGDIRPRYLIRANGRLVEAVGAANARGIPADSWWSLSPGSVTVVRPASGMVVTLVSVTTDHPQVDTTCRPQARLPLLSLSALR